MFAASDHARAEAGLHATFSDWLLPRSTARRLLGAADLHYTYDGQSALFHTFTSLARQRVGRVLVPAYHCPTVVEPLLRAGHTADFYDITPDLRHCTEPLAARITAEHVAVVVINYFGFEFDLGGMFSDGESPRPLLIEDCCHSFLHGSGQSLSGERGDVAIFSFKKLAPCYTGGAVRYNRRPPLSTPPAALPDWPTRRNFARQVLRDSIRYSDCAHLRRLSPPAPFVPLHGPVTLPPLEAVYPWPDANVTAAMPPLAQRILMNTDLEACARRRRANFQRVAARLRGLPGIEQPMAELDERTCPWGYPILLEERASTDYKLKNLGVPFFSFGEQLHPAVRPQLADFPVAADLSRRLIFLAIHQQLGSDDIDRYCDALVKFFSPGTPSP